jgi:glucosyl-3-phosphoglycerate synthase
MSADSARWFTRATTRVGAWSAVELTRRKASTRVSVVIPARNEAATIGDIVSRLRTELVERIPLVDELVVLDSDSTDATARTAADAGAIVHATRDIHPELGSHPGKGEALWKSQFVTSGEVTVFIDADLTEWGTHFVVGLLGPLLSDPRVLLVKGFYDRVLDDGSGQHRPQGGRVTELVARPLLNLRWPALSRVVQPLAGEWAIRRETFASLRIPIGYGVELATLLDVYAGHGLDSIAQVDLGSRAHSHQSVHDLGVMAAEILAVAGRRLGQEVAATELWQFDRALDPPWRPRPVPMVERPPFTTVRPAERTPGGHPVPHGASPG